MDQSSQFASVAITRSKDFSWVFFVDWALALMLALFLLFHLNRIVAFIITLCLEGTLWRKHKVKIDIQSIKFSFLGGKIFFKNFTIIDRDHTVSVVQGTLTWRYWLPKVRRTEYQAMNDNSDVNLGHNSKQPCRFSLHARGVELFIYNRTVSYDNITEQLSQHLPASHREKIPDLSHSPTDSTDMDQKERPSVSFLSKFFPLQFSIEKGALVAGNKNTQAVVIASYSSCEGLVDLHTAANPLDIARMSLHHAFDKVVISLKPNFSYDGPANLLPPRKKKPRFTGKRWVLVRQMIKLWKLATPHEHNDESYQQWKGLAQYLDDDTGSVSELQHTEQEYAKYTTLLTAESLKSHYYYDVPGLVPHDPQPTNPLSGHDIGNGGEAPKFGLDIQLSRATVHYGPWAERQRHSLHQMLFPTVCKDAVAQKKLLAGSLRQYTEFNLNVEVMDDFILRIPLREFSKSEAFFEKNKDVIDPFRAFGWVELKFVEKSATCIRLAQSAPKAGFDNRLEITLLDLEVRTSVNHDILLRCKEHNVSAEIGYPLKWDGLAAWSFVNRSKQMELFLLREHIGLISDMFTDFGAGPVTPYERFRPFTYEMQWNVLDYKLYFNINDANIVNNPLDFNDNLYLSVQGEELKVTVHVPMDAVVRSCTTIDYSIMTENFSVILDTPPWHTLNNFLKRKEVGRSQKFCVDGAYTYYSEIGLDLVDTIIIACTGKNVCLLCYGFVMKYIMSIKENYFGDFTSFRTLEEYINQGNETNNIAEGVPDDELSAKKLKRIENETDVHFSFCVEKSCIVIPYNLYDCHTNMSLHFNSLDMDIRFTNYYMDLQAELSPIKGYHHADCDQSSFLDIREFIPPGKNDFYIDTLSIHGHRVFGLPPVEPTCYCKWDITPGEIIFDSSTDVLSGFVKAFQKLGFGYKNYENHLAMEEPEVYDTTQLCFNSPSIFVGITDAGASHRVEFELINLVFQFIDFTNERFIKKVSADIEEIRALLFDLKTGNTLLDIGTSLKFTNFSQDFDYSNVRKSQNNHIAVHDAPFHRVAFFVDDKDRNRYNAAYGAITPSFTLPDVAPPLTNASLDAIFEDLKIDNLDHIDEDINLPSPSVEYNVDFIQDFDSEFLPSTRSSDGKKPRTEIPRNTMAGRKILPSQDYENSDFMPAREANPDYDTSNLIFNIAEVSVHACAEAYSPILLYMESFLKVSFKDSMDDLQVAVLQALNKEFGQLATWDNLRLVTPRVSMIFTQSSWSDHPLEKGDVEHFDIRLDNPSLAACFQGNIELQKEETIALHVLSLKCVLRNSKKGVTPLKIEMTDIEMWSKLLSDATVSVSLQTINTEIDSASSIWLAQYSDLLLKQLSDFHVSFHKLIDAYLRTRVEFMYQITMASDKYNIQHDPAVITRPAYILRLSKQHIRSKDSWKIVCRLRHILDNAPKEWLAERTTKILNQEIEAPSTVLGDVLSVFSKWRSWELADVAHSVVFKYVFAEFGPTPLKSGLFELSVENTALTVLSPDNVVNYACADFIEFSGRKLVPPENAITIPSNSFSLRVSSLKCQLGLLAHQLLPLFFIKVPQDVTRTTTDRIERQETHVVILLEEVDLKMSLPKTSIGITSSDVELTVLSTDDSNNLSAVLGSKYFEVDLMSDNNTCVNYSLTGLKATGTSVGEYVSGHKLIHIGSNDAVLTLGHGTESCVEFASNLSGDITLVRSMDWSPLVKPASNSGPVNSIYPNFHLTMENKQFGWRIGVVDPFVLTGAIDDSFLEVISRDGFVFIDAVSSSVRFDVKTYESKKSYMAVTHHGSKMFAKFDTHTKTIEFDWKYEQNHIVVTDILSRLNDLKKSLAQVLKSAKVLEAEAIILNDCLQAAVVENELKQDETKLLESLIFKKMTVSGLCLSISVELGDAKYTLELQKVLLTWNDIILGDMKPYGDLEVGNTNLKIKSRLVPLQFSDVLNVNLEVKVTSNQETNTQSLQLESSHFHAMLHPTTIVRIIQLGKDVKYILHELEFCFDNKDTSIATTKTSNFFMFSSVQMLSYSFCVGLIFERPSNTFPGIIAGSDKMFFITENGLGKFSLISAYFSIAKGANISSFFSSSDERLSANRAFLPNMQITYAETGNIQSKEMTIRVTGEELDVKFMSSSVFAIEQTLKSLSKVSKMKKYIRDHMVHSVLSPSQESYKLPENLTSINCIMNFAGGVVQLYRWDEFEPSDEVLRPAFKLQTPAVVIATSYSKTVGPKVHNVDIDVRTLPSSNTLFSECVPVVYDVCQGLKELSSLFQKESQENAKKADRGVSNNLDIHEFLAKFHFGFALKIEKQELTLSCEPSAKVQAVVGIDSIDIRLSTNDNDSRQLLSGVLDIKNVGASMQHSYSREISASVAVDELLWSLILSNGDGLKVYSAGNLEHVKSYLNLKQFQDVDLFMDLWAPSKQSTNVSTASMRSLAIFDEEEPENIVLKFQKAYGASSMPWMMDIIILDVGLEVDLGPALGIVSLELDRAWMSSRKKSMRSQDLVIGLDKIGLKSRGRLSGHLDIKNIRVNSAIQWSIVGDSQEMPSVLLSAGLESVETKAAFDYNVFLISKVNELHGSLFNQVDSKKILGDKLVAITECGSIQVYITAFAAAHVMDIHNTLSRIRLDNKTSYKEDMQTTPQNVSSQKVSDIIHSIALLRTEIDVTFGTFLLHIYPGSLLDTQVLVFDLGGADAHFDQQFLDQKVVSNLKLKLLNINVALSTQKDVMPEEALADLTIHEFITHATDAKGGGIFIFPSWECQMEIRAPPATRLIEFKYESSFGGRVDIRWNLGSINFIRDMWTVHARALSSRLVKLPEKPPPFLGDENLEEKLKAVDLSDEYEYIPLAPPIVGAPQLRDLGDATPPLEWFGLHRKSFPGLTHQYVIVGLQKLVHEVERQYGRVLGRVN